MPWGRADITASMLCLGDCGPGKAGTRGTEFQERRFIDQAVGWGRICPPCYARGWRLCGAGIEAGQFWARARDIRRPSMATNGG